MSSRRILAALPVDVREHYGVLDDQPLSIVITSDQNKLLRVPDGSMTQMHHENLVGMLRDILDDPGGFEDHVGSRRADFELGSVGGTKATNSSIHDYELLHVVGKQS